MSNHENGTGYGASSLSCEGGSHHLACDCREAAFRELIEAALAVKVVPIVDAAYKRFRRALEKVK